MTKCGETIALHRKRLNLTQTELGEQLNVTAQAVSKWENGISEPDLVTVQRLCKIFGITVDELLNSDAETEEEAPEENKAEEPLPEEHAEERAAEVAAAAAVTGAAAANAAVPAGAETQPIPPKILAGYCDVCKRPLYQGDDYTVFQHRGGRQDITCRACKTKRDKAERENAYSHEKKMFARGLICGGSIGGALAVGTAIAALVTGESLILLLLVFAVAGFTFASSLFWSETVRDIFFFFFKSFRMPGLIFALSLDGIIWLITVKLFLAILSALLSVFCFLFGCLFTPLASVVIFPFSIAAECVKLKKLKKDAQK